MIDTEHYLKPFSDRMSKEGNGPVASLLILGRYLEERKLLPDLMQYLDDTKHFNGPEKA